MSPITLVCLHGTGDAYLVCSLADAVRREHKREVRVIVKSSHKAVCEMFDVDFSIDDERVKNAETNKTMQQQYNNHGAFLGGKPYYVHPSFLRSGARLDHLTIKASTSQTDMYRALLHLPPDAPMIAGYSPTNEPKRNTVVLIHDARSWPNLHPQFWHILRALLEKDGREVDINNGAAPLAKVFEKCAESEWVIGPQCGLMAILCASQYPCRKTICTPSIDGHPLNGFPLAQTYPYAYVTKFAGLDYDVEEYKISDPEVCAAMVMQGQNARRLWPHDPKPVQSVMMPLTPGDFLDRLAVLLVKAERFSHEQSAATRRETLRYMEASSQLGPDANDHLAALKVLHASQFDLHDQFVRGAFSGGNTAYMHEAAVRANKSRILLKQKADAAFHAAYTEIKSYY